jgi:hypothetical protein
LNSNKFHTFSCKENILKSQGLQKSLCYRNIQELTFKKNQYRLSNLRQIPCILGIIYYKSHTPLFKNFWKNFICSYKEGALYLFFHTKGKFEPSHIQDKIQSMEYNFIESFFHHENLWNKNTKNPKTYLNLYKKYSLMANSNNFRIKIRKQCIYSTKNLRRKTLYKGKKECY